MLRCYSVLALCLIACAAGCGRQSASQAVYQKHVVNIAGSTSVMPFSEKLAEHFMVENPTYVINVQAGGSTAGIQACLNRTVDIGMSSRELKADEKKLNEIIICLDGIAIIVHPENPVTALTLAQRTGYFQRQDKKLERARAGSTATLTRSPARKAQAPGGL
ncbi:MAG: substrate-binding domain-containing protein [Desulfomicrobium escambiense]|nr:substrate-binding domain-containing protein [Desulfomicrobium escambiense]